MRDVVIIGAGGFGRETIDVLRAVNDVSPTWRLIGVVDDAPSEANLLRLQALGVAHLAGAAEIPDGAEVIVAVGNPSTRARIVARLAGRTFASAIHPSAVIGSEFRHGDGLVVLGGVSIGTNVTLGEHVHLNAHAVLGHDAGLEHYVSVNPAATISGECRVGAESLVGAGSTILQGLQVGRAALVGAGAVVVHDVPQDHTVKGVPAR